ncbi:MAG: trehalose-phosphatase [Candidatus Abyssobacteria bacterium SURF_5]|uniref:Trehalose 6-phosphate phosphatase n=1 Tax=Abyssobacteria bacterium (strain SURF_5) TaxID=2093360 RepID=A0A3A4NVX1_ABYX5|nr:MAG: trehalose-phosphatase [Candidatus Abyssubacteria bacterium SURF_5]
MNVLKPEYQLETFFEKVAGAQKRALLLDYDGTLAPFTPNRNEALPYPGVKEILQKLVDSGPTRVILITGRWIRDLVELLDLERLPEIWGSHGWEKLTPDGRYEIGRLEEGPLQGLAEADEWIESEGLAARAEPKPASLAIHWRGLQPREIEQLRRKIEDRLSPLAKRRGLNLHEFDGGIELRIPGRDKGYAVTTVLDEMGKDTAAAYLGDDYTDEDAFVAIRRRGLSVLVRKEFRPTEADIWLVPPEELLDFLKRWLQATSPDH